MQMAYEIFFPFLFFISKAHNMRWKDLTFVFDENASSSFYRPSKFFRFGDFEHFFSKISNFSKKINYIFLWNEISSYISLDR